MITTGHEFVFAQYEGTTRYASYIEDARKFRMIEMSIGPSLLGRALRRLADRLGTTLIALGRRLCSRGGVEVQVSFHHVRRSDNLSLIHI